MLSKGGVQAAVAYALEAAKSEKPHEYGSISVLPLRATKTVHIIRHGEGFHNVKGHSDHDAYKSEEYFDSRLTETGWRQAESLGRFLRKVNLQPDVVVVSPFSRTLETAVGAFGTAPHNPSSKAPPLMVELVAEPGKQAVHAAVSSEGLPPFVACELCREQIGMHPCDRRRTLSYYREKFPYVDFSAVEEENDVLWTADVRESREDLRMRGRRFVKWLLDRPERNIAVVSHSSFLFFMLSCFGKGEDIHIQGGLHKWFDNCEMRSFVISTAHGQPDPLHYPGGITPTEDVAASAVATNGHA